MATETKTTYKCDRCGTETEVPFNWLRLSPVNNGSFNVMQSTMEYCPSCAKLAYAALKRC